MKGIMFKEDLFNAAVEGRKTQTRRVVKVKGCEQITNAGHSAFTPDGQISIRGYWVDEKSEKRFGEWFVKPRYNTGETVYLKEPVAIGILDEMCYKYSLAEYSARRLYFDKEKRWKNKMFMPEKHARYFIRITNVRVERLQEISVTDIQAEGVSLSPVSHADILWRYAWSELWDSINKKSPHRYVDNPWVFVYEFKLEEN